MAEFKAEKIDLDLDLTLLSGEVLKLSPKFEVTTSKVIEILNVWNRIEKENKENKKVAFDIIAEELSCVYDKPEQWWKDNFDPATLQQILIHVAETVGGLKKKEVK